LQFDSHAWVVLILNLALILAFSWVSFRLLKSSLICIKLADTYLSSCQLTSTCPEHLQVKKYLFVRRMIKTDSDDDPPFLSSKFYE